MANTPSETSPGPSVESAAPFTLAKVLSRLGRRLELDEASRVLEVHMHVQSAAVVLARELGCQVTVADPSKEILERARLQAQAAGVPRQLSVLELTEASPSLPEGPFDLALCASRVRSLGSLAACLRPVLEASKGRLAAVVAARIGPTTRDVAAWESALGGTLRTPQAELTELLHAGFEPEWAEALSEEQLIQLYGARPAPAEEEAAMVQSGPAGVSFVLVVGRRREPNEAPPPARSHG